VIVVDDAAAFLKITYGARASNVTEIVLRKKKNLKR